MSLQTRAEVAIDIVARDEATRVTGRTTDQINRDLATLRKEQRAVRGEWELNNRSLASAGRLFRSVGHAANQVMSIYTAYNVMQLRISDANRTVRETHADYLEALAETGPFSEESRAALEQYNDALEDQKRAADEASLAMIGFGLSGLDAIGSLVAAIPRLKELAAAIRGVGAASSLAGAASIGGNVLPGMAGTAGKTGLLGKVGGVGGALGIAGGAALIGGGLATSAAVTGEMDNTSRLLSVAQQAGGGALLGATIGSIVPGLGTAIGAAIGGGAGLVAGLAANYSQEFGNLFGGRGFVSDADAAVATGSGKAIINQNTYNFEGYDLAEAKRIVEQEQETAEVYGE